MKPVVSVVMSVYNSASYLERALQSILSQEGVDFECVIVNDGSTDGSNKIITAAQERDARIKIVQNPQNKGLTKSLNRGIAAAQGKYIARMDADDLSYPGRLAAQVAFLEAHPEHVLVGTRAQIINEQDTIIGSLEYPTDDATLRQELIKYNPFVHASIMARAEVVRSVGGYDESWRTAQDYELYFRLIQKGKVANLPGHLVAHRFSQGSITARKNRSQVRAVIRAKIRYIKSGLYPKKALVYVIKPLIAYVLPVSWKRAIKKLVGKE